MISLFSVILLYVSLFLISLLNNSKFFYILVPVLGFSLLQFNLPDVENYRFHYNQFNCCNFFEVYDSYKFEIGYSYLAFIFSNIFTFDVFYVIIFSFTVSCYVFFYNSSFGDDKKSLAMLFLLCFFLYFICVPIRQMIASGFVALSFAYLYRNKMLLCSCYILFGSLFHIVALPALLVPFFYSLNWRRSRYLVFPCSIIFILFIFAFYFDLPSFVVNYIYFDVYEYKFNLYSDVNNSVKGVLFYCVCMVALSFLWFVNMRSKFHLSLCLGLIAVIIILWDFGFFLGRYLWLISFVVPYIFVKCCSFTLLNRYIDRFIFSMVLPLYNVFVFYRFVG